MYALPLPQRSRLMIPCSQAKLQLRSGRFRLKTATQEQGGSCRGPIVLDTVRVLPKNNRMPGPYVPCRSKDELTTMCSHLLCMHIPAALAWLLDSTRKGKRDRYHLVGADRPARRTKIPSQLVCVSKTKKSLSAMEADVPETGHGRYLMLDAGLTCNSDE